MLHPAGMKPLRVALVQPALAEYRLSLFREIAERESIDLHVYYGEEPDLPNVRPAGFAATFAPQRALLEGRLFWHPVQLSLATSKQHDVVVLSWNTRYLSLTPAIAKARSMSLGCVLWGHGYSLREGPKRRFLRRQVGRLAHANLFYDRGTARDYLAAGYESSRVFVAPNTIDQRPAAAALRYYLDRPEELTAFRDRYDLQGKQLLLFVSRHPLKRRVDVVFEAMQQLRNPQLVLAVVGGEPNREALSQITSSLGVSEQVLLLDPIYDERALAPWFITARAMCFPERIGLSAHHAFAYGLPVVVGDSVESHNPEIEAVEHQKNGLLFRHNDPAALAATLRNLVADQALQTKLATGASATARCYTVAAAADGFEAAVRYAAGRARPAT